MKKLFLVALFGVAVLFVNAQTRTEIKVADLNKVITENVAKDHAGFTIKDAYKSETNGVATYEVKIAKGTDVEVLVYDKDGKFVKKEAHKSVAVTKKQEPKKK
jgi:uncharacterized membrane protein YkoI